MLHIHCGDSSAALLRQGGVPGDVMVWCDVLWDGPVRAGLTGEAFRAERAAFLSRSTGGALTVAQCIRHLLAQDEALAAFRMHDEVVLWFDACLYDQTILMRQLAWFGRQALGNTQLSLIVAAGHPAFPRFCGLGELTAAQLAALLPTRVEVTRHQLLRASTLWDAFRQPTPATLCQLLRAASDEPLPLLREALLRFLAEYPSVWNGLTRLEEAALASVAEGCHGLPAIFVAVSAREARPFYGDTSLWGVMRRLAEAAVPALTITGPGPLPLWNPPPDLSPWQVAITAFGAELLAHRQDWITTNGCDGWRGGVQLAGRGLVWRWTGQTLEPR